MWTDPKFLLDVLDNKWNIIGISNLSTQRFSCVPDRFCCVCNFFADVFTYLLLAVHAKCSYNLNRVTSDEISEQIPFSVSFVCLSMDGVFFYFVLTLEVDKNALNALAMNAFMLLCINFSIFQYMWFLSFLYWTWCWQINWIVNSPWY